MTIRPGAVLLAAMLATSGPASACSLTTPEQARPTTVTGTATNSTPAPPPTTGNVPACGPPSLQISSPAAGSVVKAPFPISYAVHCFPIGDDGTIYLGTDGMRINLRPVTDTGTVTVPDHPLLSGHRTLTIQLANQNGQALANPEANVIIGLTIEGSR